MAFYKAQQYLSHNSDATFDVLYHPAQHTPYSGIYRCEGCGVEAVSTKGHPLPPQNHHQHTALQGPIRWRLIVMSTHS